MNSSISDRPKKRGRPATGRDPYLGFRSPPEITDALDAWIAAQPDPKPSRSDAIRRLLQKALAAEQGCLERCPEMGKMPVSQKAAAETIPLDKLNASNDE